MILIHSWLNPKLEVRKFEGGGRGVFAKESIGVGEKLAIFGGHIMRINEEPEFLEDQKDLAHQIDEQFVMGTKYENEIEDTDYFNHSCSPNAGFKGQIFLVAMRNIEPDEEITFDYAMVIHKPKDSTFIYQFRCHCGSPDCRGQVTFDDWKSPEIQKRYDGYFSWYLQEKITSQRIENED
jgi:uncharacterized protein